MEYTIDYKGIRTNNLKGIDFSITENSFIGITGPSGSGKTSLAYGTIYGVSQTEWSRISNQPVGVYLNYKLDDYQNIKPTIALKQDNKNTNPRSVLATFLHLDREFRLLFSIVSGLSPSRFSINNPSNSCPRCSGIGLISILDEKLLIDWNKTILEKPFLLFTKPQELALLEKFAEAHGIPLTVPISNLTSGQKNTLLYGKSEQKYSVKYKMGGKVRVRSFYYTGYLDFVSDLHSDTSHISALKKIEKAQKQALCPCCHGMKFSDHINSFKYKEYSIGELYAMELSDLLDFVLRALQVESSNDIKKLLGNIYTIVNRLVLSNLGYLTLNRSVPTLSGGELQRVQLVGLTTTKLSDILYIVDEPSSSLHVSEYDAVLADLKELRSKGNTILMVEHNPYFLRNTDGNIFIGPGSGTQGGEILKSEPKIDIKPFFIPKSSSKWISYSGITENNLKNISVKIPEGCITGIYGVSGSGKTTLSKYIEQVSSHVEYISQKVLRGSRTSSIGTYSGILPELKELYSQSNGLSHSISLTDSCCQCPKCQGKGTIRHSLDFSSTIVEVLCDECAGKKYNKEILELEYEGIGFEEVLSTPIDSLLQRCSFAKHKKITELLLKLSQLGLGHLCLSRTTDTLSGGESQRLKTIKVIGKRTKNKILIFDEPLKGLGISDAIKLLKIFKTMSENGATVIMVEHSVVGFLAVDYVIELGPGKGKLGGGVLYEGWINDFKESAHWEKYKDKGAI